MVYRKKLSKTKILIVGGGKEAMAFLEVFHDKRDVKILGVIDKNRRAPAMVIAKSRGIRTSTKIEGFIKKHRSIDVIINTTSDPKVSKHLEMIKPPGTEAAGGIFLRTLWDILRESRRIQIEAEKRELQLKNIIEKSSDGVLIIGAKFEIYFANPAAYSLFGTKRAKKITDIIKRSSQTFTSREINIIHKNKRTVVADMRIVKTKWEGEKAYLMLLRDVTARNRAEWVLKENKNELEARTKTLIESHKTIKILYRELEEKNRSLQEIDQLKSDFVATVSHELKTPLAITKEGLSLVLDRITGELTPKQDKILKAAKNNIERLARIINDLLDIAKIEAGKIAVRRRLVDIKDLVENVVFIFKPQIKKKKLGIQVDMPRKSVDVYADQDKLNQVLTNLVGNAIKFTEKGKISIKVALSGEEVVFSVSDSGRGIDKKDLPQVFQKFQQFGPRTGSGEKGTGLGLTITKNIVELHGGRIWVESALKKGSTFFFTIPKFGSAGKVCDQILNEAIERVNETIESTLSLIVVNVSNMKYIEQKFTKKGSSRVLSSIRNIITSNLTRLGDTIAAYEYDTIMVVLPNTDKKGAFAVCDRIRSAAALKHVTYAKNKIIPDIRFGISAYPEDGRDSESIIDAANIALAKKKKILVIDDHPQIVRLISNRIETDSRFRCMPAYGGEEAIQLADETVPDLIICDIVMPEISGYEVIGRLKTNKKTKDVPVIILASDVEEHDKAKSVLPNSIPIISKSEGLNEVLTLVNSII